MHLYTIVSIATRAVGEVDTAADVRAMADRSISTSGGKKTAICEQKVVTLALENGLPEVSRGAPLLFGEGVGSSLRRLPVDYQVGDHVSGVIHNRGSMMYARESLVSASVAESCCSSSSAAASR